MGANFRGGKQGEIRDVLGILVWEDKLQDGMIEMDVYLLFISVSAVSVLVVSHTLQFLLPNKSSFGYQLRLTVSQDNLAHISSFWTFILLAE